MIRRAGFIWAVVVFGGMGIGAASDAPNAAGRSVTIRPPLAFEANRGQTDPSVRFMARGEGYALFLTPGEAVFKLRPDGAKAPAAPAVLRMQLRGAAQTNLAGTEPLPGTVNYFIGNDPAKWKTQIETFGRVTYPGVYPGIDLIYYGTERQLEYDFVVAPGADPQSIRLHFEGARAQLNANGNLSLAIAGRALSFRKPVVYQMEQGRKRFVAGAFSLRNGDAGFTVGSYDRSKPLTIDPSIVYETYLGGSLTDNIGYYTGIYPSGESDPTQGLAVDSLGNAYVVGWTYSSDFPVQNAYETAPSKSSAAYSAFVTKLNPTGTALVYSTYLAGSVYDNGTSIAVDANFNAYVGGTTQSPDFPVTSGAFMTTCAGWNPCGLFGPAKGFITKLSASGSSLVFSTYLGGTTNGDYLSALAVDPQGRTYVTGYSYDSCDTTYMPANSCFPETGNAVLPETLFDRKYTPNATNQGSAFLTVFDPAGASLLYSTLYGDSDPPLYAPTNMDFPVIGTGVAVDAAGNFYLSGSTRDWHLPTTPGSYEPTIVANSIYQGYVAKFSSISSGAQLLYATYLGGANTITGSTQVSSVTADANGSAYVTGMTSASDFPVTPGAYQNSCVSSCSSGFITKFKPDGSGLLWSTYFGSHQGLQSAGLIHLDTLGNVYIGGTASWGSGFPSVNSVQTNSGGSGQAYVAKMNPTGSTLYFASLVGAGGVVSSQSGQGLAIDSAGNIYLAGDTNGGGLPATPGAFQPNFAPGGSNGGDGFIAKINPFVTSNTALLVNPNSTNAGQNITFTATVTGSGGLTPTGTVNFMNGAALLGSAALNGSGVAVFSSATLAAGSYSVTADYSGDNTYSPSQSSPQPLTIGTTGEPQFTWSVTSSGVQSPGVLYVNLKVVNTGTGLAANGKVTALAFRTITGTGTATMDPGSPPLPIALGNLGVGQSATVRILVDAPATIVRFTVTETGTVMDAQTKSYSYSSSELVLQ